MKKLLLIGFMALCLTFINEQAKATGLIYTNTTYPIAVTGVQNNDLSTLKKGSSSTTNVLYLFEIGNASVDECVKQAGIKKISYVDVNEKSIFIFWRSLTVNVYGE